MAGHSKWANIKFKKAAQDKKRGKMFTKLIREITVAARMGGGDLNANPRLRLATDKALSANMTRDTIDRAIKRGAGDQDGEHVEEITYEGYGPAGVAILVDCLTDNRNRTVGEVRHAFTKAGGNLGTDGSVAYFFKKQGQLMFAPGADADKVMDVAIESGAEDVIIDHDQSILIVTSPEAFASVKKAMITANVTPDADEITMNASLKVTINDKETAEKVIRLVDLLEDLDDVQEVFTNADIAADLLETL